MKFFPLELDRKFLILGGAVILLLIISSNSWAVAATSLQAVRAFAGDFEYIGGVEEKEAWKAAIEDAVAGMSFLLRPLARPYLRYRIDIPEDLTIEVERDKLFLRFGEKSGDSAVLNGPWLIEGEGEKALRIRHSFKTETGEVLQEIINDRGIRKRLLHLEDSGKRLRLRTVVESEQLSAPIDYELNFRRRGLSK